LGNHTYAHEPASRQAEERFAESLTRCDALLQRVGAFASGGPKWFRFPHLDRGRDPAHRRQLVLHCERLGYRIAPATIDLFDYAYDGPLAAAISRRSERDAARVERRFLRTCLEKIEAATTAFTEQTPALSHVAYAHFGAIAERNLSAILDLLRSRKLELCSLGAALDHPVYRDFAADLTRNGLIVPAAPRDLRARIRRRLALAAERFIFFDRSR
jgi:peptidoglycan-N-acetylglucosamine deacetylase